MKTKTKRKRKTKAQAECELHNAYEVLMGKLECVHKHYEDGTAISLEYMAHTLEGIMDDCQKTANLAGYLAELIDPNVADKV